MLCSVQLKRMILFGELPCSKEEAAALAVIQLRIEETSPELRDDCDSGPSSATITPAPPNIMHQASLQQQQQSSSASGGSVNCRQMASSINASIRQSSIIKDDMLRPICEDVKASSGVEIYRPKSSLPEVLIQFCSWAHLDHRITLQWE